VGPRDAATGDVIGGKTSGYGTLEMTFPIIENVRGAAFFDAGFVSEDEWDPDVGSLYSDAGMGLRLNLPFGPLALDYAFPVSSVDDEADNGGQFNFYLNYQF
jgi:outer membrane protein insertion porin family